MKKEEIMKRVQEHYNYLISKGYEVVYLGLQGSQNYGLDIYTEDYMSDVDTKAIVLPSFEDFVYNRQPTSVTAVLENNEHIDVKDVRIMFECFKKQNINFIEILFTDYYILNYKYEDLVQVLLDNAEQIAHLNINQALRCMAGMSKEKLNALEHPYPTIKDKIEKYGYDPKQLHHICRMNDFIKRYESGEKYKSCLTPTKDKVKAFLDVKRGILCLEDARFMAKIVDEDTYKFKEEHINEIDIINKEAIEILDKIKYNLLKRKFKEDLKEV